MQETIQIYDVFDIKENMEEPFRKTQEGYLKGRAIVTNIGAFPYRTEKGKTLVQLRTPEEVFSDDSLESLKMIPFTNEHPKEFVTTDNVTKLSCGFTGSDVRIDGYHASVDITVTDKKCVEDIENGKLALSCGYNLTLDFEEGVYLGMPYQAIQKNIRYNHLALVEKGRAGDACKIKIPGRIDKADDVNLNKYYLFFDKKEKQKNININIDKEDVMPDNLNLKTVNIDGVNFQAEAEVISSYVKASKANDEYIETIKEKNESISKLEAERDTIKSQLDSIKKEIEELKTKKTDEAVIDAAIQEKLELLEVAKAAEVEANVKDSTHEIMKKVIEKIFPKLNLDEKDETYIKVSFDNARVVIEEKKEAEDEAQEAEKKNRETVFSDKARDSNTEDKSEAQKAYDSYIKNLENAWKKKEDK